MSQQRFEHIYLDKKKTQSDTYLDVVALQLKGWEIAAVDKRVIWMKRPVTCLEETADSIGVQTFFTDLYKNSIKSKIDSLDEKVKKVDDKM